MKMRKAGMLRHRLTEWTCTLSPGINTNRWKRCCHSGVDRCHNLSHSIRTCLYRQTSLLHLLDPLCLYPSALHLHLRYHLHLIHQRLAQSLQRRARSSDGLQPVKNSLPIILYLTLLTTHPLSRLLIHLQMMVRPQLTLHKICSGFQRHCTLNWRRRNSRRSFANKRVLII